MDNYCYLLELEDAVYEQLQESCLKNKLSISDQISTALTFQSEHVKKLSINQIASQLCDLIIVPKNYKADWSYDELSNQLDFEIVDTHSNNHSKPFGLILLRPVI